MQHPNIVFYYDTLFIYQQAARTVNAIRVGGIRSVAVAPVAALDSADRSAGQQALYEPDIYDPGIAKGDYALIIKPNNARNERNIVVPFYETLEAAEEAQRYIVGVLGNDDVMSSEPRPLQYQSPFQTKNVKNAPAPEKERPLDGKSRAA